MSPRKRPVPVRGPSLAAGMFVRMPARLGIGKVEQVVGEATVVRLFHSMVESEERVIHTRHLQRTHLSRETRVYVTGSGRQARIGRVVGATLTQDCVEYEVQFPNGEVQFIEEKDLNARCWSRRTDPTELLASGIGETQFLHDRRHLAIRMVLQMRAASEGLTGLVSSAVEFVPHQIAVIRRVLTDPVLRYLLADEVGLGKTVEAGIIIRQCLIDFPDRHVLVLVPASLVPQWQSELTDKFHVGSFSGSVDVEPYENAAQLLDEDVPDLLVVDEVHQVVGQDHPHGHAIQKLAGRVTRLLLLSATPSLADAQTFLAVLRILDPHNYQQCTLEEFEARLQSRREFGRLLLGLAPDASGLILRRRATEARALFPQDSVVMALSTQLEAATRDAPEDAGRIAVTLRQHIADAYRINQRILRSRRIDAHGWEFQPRGPTVAPEAAPTLQHIKVEVDEDLRIPDLLSLLEDWRQAALAHSRSEVSPSRSDLSRTYRQWMEALGVGTEALGTALSKSDLHFAEDGNLRSAMHDVIARGGGPRTRVDVVLDCLRGMRQPLGGAGPAKVVAFTSSTPLAEEIAALASKRLGTQPETVLFGATDSEFRSALRAFRNEPDAWLLIADQSGEEGLNLENADAILHVDLPLSVTRIEQRIGRADRFGRKAPRLRQRVLIPSDEDAGPWSAWFDLLAHGLLVFNQSVSDVQLLLRHLENDIETQLFELGPRALLDMASAWRSRLAIERSGADEQHALDSIALAEESTADLLATIERVEEKEEQIMKGIEPWLLQALKLGRTAGDPFQLTWTDFTLIQKDPWFTEMGLDRDTAMTWKRSTALRHEGTTLLRPGAQFIDAMERYMRWDDRGASFLTWRADARVPSEPSVYFRMCFVLEPDLDEEKQIFGSGDAVGVLRRAYRFLTPTYHVLHTDSNGAVVTDPIVTEILSRGYSTRTGTDLNLGSRPVVLGSVLDQALLPELCRRVRRMGETIIKAQPSVLERINMASKLAAQDAQRRINRLQSRSTWESEFALSDEINLSERITQSVSRPRFRLDAMGLFVLSTALPNGGPGND